MPNEVLIKLRWVAAILAALVLLIFVASYPETPEAYQERREEARMKAAARGLHLGLFDTDAMFRTQDTKSYPQCLVSDRYEGNPCPVGGNLYWLLWLGIAGVVASFVFVKKDPPTSS